MTDVKKEQEQQSTNYIGTDKAVKKNQYIEHSIRPKKKVLTFLI